MQRLPEFNYHCVAYVADSWKSNSGAVKNHRHLYVKVDHYGEPPVGFISSTKIKKEAASLGEVAAVIDYHIKQIEPSTASLENLLNVRAAAIQFKKLKSPHGITLRSATNAERSAMLVRAVESKISSFRELKLNDVKTVLAEAVKRMMVIMGTDFAHTPHTFSEIDKVICESSRKRRDAVETSASVGFRLVSNRLWELFGDNLEVYDQAATKVDNEFLTKFTLGEGDLPLLTKEEVIPTIEINKSILDDAQCIKKSFIRALFKADFNPHEFNVPDTLKGCQTIYRKLALKSHADKNQEEGAEDKMKKLNDIYETEFTKKMEALIEQTNVLKEMPLDNALRYMDAGFVSTDSQSEEILDLE